MILVNIGFLTLSGEKIYNHDDYSHLKINQTGYDKDGTAYPMSNLTGI